MSSQIKLPYSHISCSALDVPGVYDNMWVLTGVAMGGCHSKFGFVMVWFQKTVGRPNFHILDTDFNTRYFCFFWHWCIWFTAHVQRGIIHVKMKISKWRLQKGVVYILYKIRSSIEAWGTLYFNETSVDVRDPIWTTCVWYLRYDSNHLRVTPLISKDCLDQFKSSQWTRVSNAALRSSRSKWPLPNVKLVRGHFVQKRVLSLCSDVVSQQTEISHTSCWFSNALLILLIECRQCIQQALKWMIG